MKTVIVLAGTALCLLAAAWAVRGEEGGASAATRDRLVVGVFDSRAVAIAYADSRHNREYLNDLMKRHGEALEAGDAGAVAGIEREAGERQHRFHLMGFGTHPVDELLAVVVDRLPGVAEAAGVDLVVSRWAVRWQAPDARLVDVTRALVDLFDPGERTLRIVEQLKDHPPTPR